MPFDLTTRTRGWRLRLAQLAAPAGADVHDPDDTVCPQAQALLEAVLYHDIEINRHGGAWMRVTEDLHDLAADGLIEPAQDGDYRLTEQGERELGRRWGDHRVPPWSGGYFGCSDHGVYEAAPGDPEGCPECPPWNPPRTAGWWRLRRVAGMVIR